MKQLKLMVVALVVAMGSLSASAFDWKQLGSALSSGSTLSNVINNVISTDSITVADVTGEWKYSGPAVSFKSDDLLKKAGGAAVAATVESKLAPYYQRAGIEGLKMTFDGKGNATMVLKNGRTLNGTVKQGEKAGQLVFNFSRLGSNFGNLTAYVSKGTDLSIMFDVSKLQGLVSAIAKYSKNSTANTASELLSQYKGIYAGIKLSK
ncbi:MAG: lipocalin-like domain-containing protein [Muribaculaceae bacterium]